jgi:serpin B
LHKAFVAVDEEGTEAAATTAVIIGTTAAPVASLAVTIDRPFVFVIRDSATGTISFAGRVLNPGSCVRKSCNQTARPVFCRIGV